MTLDPVLLRGSLHETIWGGRHLAEIAGKTLPPGALVGESWETATDSVAINHPYIGRTLGDLAAAYGARLYGGRAQQLYGDRFPLLAKFIDAQAWLSVQDHPDDAYAAAHENGKLGKTEAWRVLRAEPDARIIHGLARACDRAEVEAAIRATRLEELTDRPRVRAGDVVLNRAGTLHATGAGIVLYEIQEYSDVTYRLYDFGRVDAHGQPRELHIARGLDVLDYRPLSRHVQQPISLTDPAGGPPAFDDPERLLVACEHFALAEVRVSADRPFQHATVGGSCQIITIIQGAARIAWGDASNASWAELPLGQTVVIPAEHRAYTLTVESRSEPAVALVSWVPEIHNHYVRAWEAAQA